MTREKILFLAEDAAQFSSWMKLVEEQSFEVALQVIQSPEQLEQTALRGVHYVIEWLPVSDNLKKTVLKKIGPMLPENILLLSATHEGMATAVASWLPHPGQLVGFSPMSLYREIKHVTLTLPTQADPETRQKADTFCQTLGLIPYWVEDAPGLIFPRIYAMIANEAAFALQEHVASAADIDTAMCLGTNYPMGPLAWADQVGVDTVLNILESLWQTYREERYRPCLLLQKMVLAGLVGKRCGKGFYHYSSAGQVVAESQNLQEKVQV